MAEGRPDWSIAFSDAVNQLMTLCAGAIIVVATFLERFTAGARWQPLAGIAVLGFLACLVTLVLAKVQFAFSALRSEGGGDRFNDLAGWHFLSYSVMIFLFSIACLAFFAARNFF